MSTLKEKDKAILLMAAKLLNDYEQELSYNGCNDTENEVLDLIEKVGLDEFSVMAEKWNGEKIERPERTDWIVCGVVSHRIKEIVNEN